MASALAAMVTMLSSGTPSVCIIWSWSAPAMTATLSAGLGEIGVGVDALGIAVGDQQALAVGGVGLGIDDLLAALGADRHFGRGHVEAVGLQAGDERGEVGHHPLDVVGVDAELP